MDAFLCRKPAAPLHASVRLPGSKSLTNRALVVASLADGHSVLDGALFAEDTLLMVEALRQLGVAVTLDELAQRIEITGCAGHLPVEEADLYCGNSGTTLRFCAALCAAGFGRFRLDGSARMRERPVGALADALRTLGAGVEFEMREGFPPLRIHARHLRGGALSIDGRDSSQFASAVLLVASSAQRDVLLEVTPPVVSRPYLRMTCAVLEAFGVGAIEQHATDDARFIVPAPQRAEGRAYPVEPDASNAAPFLAAPCVAGGEVTLEGLTEASVQGDIAWLNLLERMGGVVRRGPSSTTLLAPPAGRRLHALDVDLSDTPDLVQPLAVLALFAEGATTIRNVANLRIKETDRLVALARELTKLGATVVERSDGLRIAPPVTATPATIDTYNDHRMAMSFALAGLGIDGVRIADPSCCGKTFPNFFELWDRMLATGAAP